MTWCPAIHLCGASVWLPGRRLTRAIQPWLVFCSPPYDLYVSQLQPMLELLQKIVDVAPPLSLVVVEADERFDPGNLPTSYAWDVRSYPPAVLAVGEQRPLTQSTPTPLS